MQSAALRRDPRLHQPHYDDFGLRLVVGGGRAIDYPRLRRRDVSVDVAATAQPHIHADVRRLPIPAAVFRVVDFEFIPFMALTRSDGAGIDEAVRVLQPGGRLRIRTGGMAPVDFVVDRLRRNGMQHIAVEAPDGGSVFIRARKPGHTCRHTPSWRAPGGSELN